MLNRNPGESRGETQNVAKEGDRAPMDRRDFLRKAGVGGAAALAWLSQACKPGPDKESGVSEVKEALDPGVAIIMEEFEALCEKGVTYSNYDDANSVTQEMMKSIQLKINAIEPNALDGQITPKQIIEYAKKKGFHLEMSLNQIRDGRDRKTIHHTIFIGVHQVQETENANYKEYFPEYLQQDGQHPNVEILTVGSNLVTKFDNTVAKATFYADVSILGTTRDGGIILFGENIKQNAQENGIPVSEERQETISNEMGHVIFHHIFGDINILNQPGLVFGDGNYTPAQVNEALSDLCTLKYGSKNQKLFLQNLNKRLNIGPNKGYDFSIDVFTRALQQTSQEMGIATGTIPAERFEEFREKFTEKAARDVFGTIGSLHEFAIQQMQKQENR